jgi:cytochrome c oxidase subunit 2
MVTGWPHMSNPADGTFFFILGISITLLVLNTGAMIFFVVRYSKKRHPRAEEVKESIPLEITWTVIPTILVLAIFFVGWKGFQYMRTAPPDAMVVKVTAREWSWTFDYENGKETTVLKVPVRQPVKLLITSTDVLHSLYIPAYRIKEDAVPGRETHLWFLPDELGSYDLFCTEYCGIGHSDMITKVEVMTEKDFDAWYKGGKRTVARTETKKPEKRAEVKGPSKQEAVKVEEGAKLIVDKGCVLCHTTDGSPKVGPTFKGLYGRKVIVMTDGKEREIIADDEYIKRSIKDPKADIVKGFPSIMPVMQLSDDEINEIVEYLKKLK